MTYILTTMFLSSVLIQVFKNNMADNYLKRKGFVINKDPRSLTEKISSFTKDYFYILIPFYNIYKAIKVFAENDSEYILRRETKLKRYEKLSEKEEPSKKEEVKLEKSKKTEVKKEEPKYIEKPKMVEKVKEKEEISEIEYLTKLKKYYLLERRKLARYFESNKEKLSQEEKKNIIIQVKEYDKRFYDCQARIKQLTENQMELKMHR